MARKTQELRPVMTRLPEPLRKRLERDAAHNGRSMNTEIIYRLEQSSEKDARIGELKGLLRAALDVIQSQSTALNALRPPAEQKRLEEEDLKEIISQQTRIEESKS
jgi:hypothetical protein